MKLGHLLTLCLLLLFGVTITIFYIARTNAIDMQRLAEQREIAAFNERQKDCQDKWPLGGERYQRCLNGEDTYAGQ